MDYCLARRLLHWSSRHVNHWQWQLWTPQKPYISKCCSKSGAVGSAEADLFIFIARRTSLSVVCIIHSSRLLKPSQYNQYISKYTVKKWKMLNRYVYRNSSWHSAGHPGIFVKCYWWFSGGLTFSTATGGPEIFSADSREQFKSVLGD